MMFVKKIQTLSVLKLDYIGWEVMAMSSGGLFEEILHICGLAQEGMLPMGQHIYFLSQRQPKW